MADNNQDAAEHHHPNGDTNGGLQQHQQKQNTTPIFNTYIQQNLFGLETTVLDTAYVVYNLYMRRRRQASSAIPAGEGTATTTAVTAPPPTAVVASSSTAAAPPPSAKGIGLTLSPQTLITAATNASNDPRSSNSASGSPMIPTSPSTTTTVGVASPPSAPPPQLTSTQGPSPRAHMLMAASVSSSSTTSPPPPQTSTATKANTNTTSTVSSSPSVSQSLLLPFLKGLVDVEQLPLADTSQRTSKLRYLGTLLNGTTSTTASSSATASKSTTPPSPTAITTTARTLLEALTTLNSLVCSEVFEASLPSTLPPRSERLGYQASVRDTLQEVRRQKQLVEDALNAVSEFVEKDEISFVAGVAPEKEKEKGRRELEGMEGAARGNKNDPESGKTAGDADAFDDEDAAGDDDDDTYKAETAANKLRDDLYDLCDQLYTDLVCPRIAVAETLLCARTALALRTPEYVGFAGRSIHNTFRITDAGAYVLAGGSDGGTSLNTATPQQHQLCYGALLLDKYRMSAASVGTITTTSSSATTSNIDVRCIPLNWLTNDLLDEAEELMTATQKGEEEEGEDEGRHANERKALIACRIIVQEVPEHTRGMLDAVLVLGVLFELLGNGSGGGGNMVGAGGGSNGTSGVNSHTTSAAEQPSAAIPLGGGGDSSITLSASSTAIGALLMMLSSSMSLSHGPPKDAATTASHTTSFSAINIAELTDDAIATSPQLAAICDALLGFGVVDAEMWLEDMVRTVRKRYKQQAEQQGMALGASTTGFVGGVGGGVLSRAASTRKMVTIAAAANGNGAANAATDESNTNPLSRIPSAVKEALPRALSGNFNTPRKLATMMMLSGGSASLTTQQQQQMLLVSDGDDDDDGDTTGSTSGADDPIARAAEERAALARVGNTFNKSLLGSSAYLSPSRNASSSNLASTMMMGGGGNSNNNSIDALITKLDNIMGTPSPQTTAESLSLTTKLYDVLGRINMFLRRNGMSSETRTTTEGKVVPIAVTDAKKIYLEHQTDEAQGFGRRESVLYEQACLCYETWSAQNTVRMELDGLLNMSDVEFYQECDAKEMLSQLFQRCDECCVAEDAREAVVKRMDKLLVIRVKVFHHSGEVRVLTIPQRMRFMEFIAGKLAAFFPDVVVSVGSGGGSPPTASAASASASPTQQQRVALNCEVSFLDDGDKVRISSDEEFADLVKMRRTIVIDGMVQQNGSSSNLGATSTNLGASQMMLGKSQLAKSLMSNAELKLELYIDPLQQQQQRPMMMGLAGGTSYHPQPTTMAPNQQQQSREASPNTIYGGRGGVSGGINTAVNVPTQPPQRGTAAGQPTPIVQSSATAVQLPPQRLGLNELIRMQDEEDLRRLQAANGGMRGAGGGGTAIDLSRISLGYNLSLNHQQQQPQQHHQPTNGQGTYHLGAIGTTDLTTFFDRKMAEKGLPSPPSFVNTSGGASAGGTPPSGGVGGGGGFVPQYRPAGPPSQKQQQQVPSPPPATAAAGNNSNQQQQGSGVGGGSNVRNMFLAMGKARKDGGVGVGGGVGGGGDYQTNTADPRLLRQYRDQIRRDIMGGGGGTTAANSGGAYGNSVKSTGSSRPSSADSANGRGRPNGGGGGSSAVRNNNNGGGSAPPSASAIGNSNTTAMASSVVVIATQNNKWQVPPCDANNNLNARGAFGGGGGGGGAWGRGGGGNTPFSIAQHNSSTIKRSNGLGGGGGLASGNTIIIADTNDSDPDEDEMDALTGHPTWHKSPSGRGGGGNGNNRPLTSNDHINAVANSGSSPSGPLRFTGPLRKNGVPLPHEAKRGGGRR